MKIITSNANIGAAVHNRLYETYILIPVRMQSDHKSKLYELFEPRMPDIVSKIESHEKFYKNRKTRYDIETVVLFKEFSNEGYTVCVILLDDNDRYDRDMWDRAIARICSRCGDKTTFRAAKTSDVLSAEDWETAMGAISRHGNQRSIIELYANIGETQNTCEQCAHREVCKFLFMNKPQPDCQYFLNNQ